MASMLHLMILFLRISAKKKTKVIIITKHRVHDDLLPVITIILSFNDASINFKFKFLGYLSEIKTTFCYN